MGKVFPVRSNKRHQPIRSGVFLRPQSEQGSCALGTSAPDSALTDMRREHLFHFDDDTTLYFSLAAGFIVGLIVVGAYYVV